MCLCMERSKKKTVVKKKSWIAFYQVIYFISVYILWSGLTKKFKLNNFLSVIYFINVYILLSALKKISMCCLYLCDGKSR